MDTKLLHYFLRVAEIRSINKAALDLGLSQPALSRHIAALEHDVGAALFVRDRRGVRLTPAGKLLMERAQPILRGVSLLRDELGRQAIEQVSLAISVSLLRMLAVPLTAYLAEHHPLLRLRLYEGINTQIRAWLTDGLIDLGLISFQTEPVALFEQVPLVRDPLYVIGDASTSLRMQNPVSPSELAHMKLILPGRPNYVRHLVESALRRAGREYVAAVDAETHHLCMDLVLERLGYTVAPSSALYKYPLIDRISAAPISGLNVTWALVMNKQREQAAGVRLVRDKLKQLIISQIEGGNWPGGELLGSR